ncbi:MAG: hypothetical protein WED07_02225 [Candidatus Freyarchaeum deiterrae]
MPQINSFYNAVIFGTLLSAADKIGMKPMILGRQASKILKPLIGTLAQKAIGKDPPSNMEELIEAIKEIAKNSGLTESNNLEMNFSGNCLSVKGTDCMYSEMAEYGKSIGYDACPVCVTGVVLMSIIGALGFGEVIDLKIENSGKTCLSKMVLDQSK